MTPNEIEELGATTIPQVGWHAEPVDSFADAPLKVTGLTPTGESVQLYVFTSDTPHRVQAEMEAAYKRWMIRSGRGW